jgi:serine/threonine protein kinase
VLGDLLGRGGMAEVFAGYAVGDHGFQKPVAIKRLLPELANDEVFVDRLIEEAKILVGMQHGNIVSVLDLAREGDDVFLVMEFVDGPSLRQLIKARGPRGLSLGAATYIIQSAAAGLEFAHARPGGAIIHADISPSNLLLTTSGEVRVADFGIARREGLGQGVVEGKWAYMAPEQARGEPLTPRSDVFALGVVIYELLTGQHPFGRAVTASERDENMRVVPPRAIKPTVPPGLDAICMRALAHDARDRYGRMQALIDALVEERFTHGYREGASDLAQAIREAAPSSDPAPPRTMHTDRPVTIVTRSLLRDVTPAHRPSYPLGPLDPPPPHEFPMQPTAGATSARAIDMPSTAMPIATPVPAPAPTDVQTRLVQLPSLHADAAVPPSGAQTAARVVDQVAFAEAAQAAAALMQIPPSLRADGTPMPPFRMAQPALPGGELASVVGGHTLSGQAVAIAVEPRGHRWTIAVLVAAALIGVGSAVAIQMGSGKPHRVAAALPVDGAARPAGAQTTAKAAYHSLAAVFAPAPVDPPAESATDPQTVAPQTLEPTIPPVLAVAPASPEPTETAPSGSDPAAESDPGDGKANDGRPRRPSTSSTSREAAKHKVEPGILWVEARPWAWVTVGNQRKETPDRFYLAPGTYSVKFFNQDNGLTKYQHVTIESGKLVRIREQLDSED